MDNKEVVPIIVDGNLNEGKQPKKVVQEKLPKKRFTFMDLLLTLIGLVLIGYGVLTIVNPQEKKQEEKKEEIPEPTQKVDVSTYVLFNVNDSSNIYTEDDIKALPNGLDVTSLSNNAILSYAARSAAWTYVDGKSYITEEDLDKSVKKIFGDIPYTKAPFSYSNKSITYNKETKRFYLLSENDNVFNYKKYYHKEVIDNDTELMIQEYVAYTDDTKSWTINNAPLDIKIDNTNIDDNYPKLKYYEYTFVKENDSYILKRIMVK